MATIGALVAQLTALIIFGVTEIAGSQSPIVGDPGLYRVIATAIIGGDVPYIDYPLEHLPGAVLPMLAVEGLSRLSGVGFLDLWPIAMGLAFIVTVAMANLFPTDFDAGRRVLWYSLPLLPLVLFRTEPWLMAWVVASMLFAFRGSWTAQVLSTVFASLTKGWPLLMFALPFQLSRRRVALVSAGATVAALIVVAALPGFREGRAFEGIHTETVVGSIVLTIRAFRGFDVQLISAAGAAYTVAPANATMLNALIGLPFLAIAGTQALRASDPTRLMRIVGLGVLGVILASPLFSTQFVFWLVPFVILTGTRTRRTFLVVAFLSLASIIVWDPHTLLWNLLVLVRNILLVGLGISWAREILSLGIPDASDRSLKPVT